MTDSKYLKDESNLLYIESLNIFRSEISDILKNFFHDVYVATNVNESIELFTKHQPQVTIIDIDVSSIEFNWLEVAMQLKEIDPEAKIVILSEHNDQELLLDAIDIGITKFLIKPVKHNDISDVLKSVISKINYGYDTKIFYKYLHSDLVSSIDSMVVMFDNKKPIMANQVFLNFFNLKSIKEFNHMHEDIGYLFLEKDGYLYNDEYNNWFETVSKNPKKAHHVQIKNKQNEIRHFILKYNSISEEKSYSILSFDDVTQLDMLKEHEIVKIKSDPLSEDKKTIYKLLELIKKNNIVIDVYNYYKGLSIVHSGAVFDIKGENILIKTDSMQQKAIQLEDVAILSSKNFPHPIVCNKVLKTSYERGISVLSDCMFSKSAPAKRKTIRLVPHERHGVSIFIKEQKFRAELKIIDISLDSVKISSDYPPTIINVEDRVFIDMILSHQNKPFIINTEATLLKKVKSAIGSIMIFQFHLDSDKKRTMLKYLASRQVEIIKEFKSLHKHVRG